MYENLTDEQLLRYFNIGNQAAFTEIYNRYWGVLFAHAMRLVQDKELARDAVQDVFLMFLAKTGQMGQVKSVPGFLTKCMCNRILDYFNHRKIHADFVSRLQKYSLESAEYSEELLMEKLDALDQQLQQRIEDEIAHLPPKMRLAFELSHRHQLSHKEIAQRTGTATETIKKQVYYAMKILRGKLLPLVIVLIYHF